jgi:hypothetical protein
MMTQAQSVTALFGPTAITVRTTITGRGRIACRPACSLHFEAGDALTVRPVAAKGWRFKVWAGACSGRLPICRPATDLPLVVHATFAKLPPKPKPKKR